MSKEGQRGSGKQKYPRGWRPLSRFNEACSCRRWRVIWQSADLFHSRADTSRERHSRKLAPPPPPPPPPPPIPKLRESPLESNTNRTGATIAVPNWRHFSSRNTSRRSREARRRYNDFRDENYVLPRQTTFPSLSNRLFCFSCRRSCIAALFTQRNAPFVIRDLLRINFRSMDTIFYSSRSNFSYIRKSVMLCSFFFIISKIRKSVIYMIFRLNF